MPLALRDSSLRALGVQVPSKAYTDVIDSILRNFNRLRAMSHPNLINPVGIILRQPGFDGSGLSAFSKPVRWFVSEPANGVALSVWLLAYIKHHARLSIGLLRSIMLGVLEPLAYLHSRAPPFIHGSLDRHNIIVGMRPDGSFASVKLGSVGLGAWDVFALDPMLSPLFVARSRFLRPGSLLDPEIYGGAHCSSKSDVYAFSKVFYDMLCRAVVYAAFGSPDAPTAAEHQFTKKQLIAVAPSLLQFMYRCMAEEADERLDSGDALDALRAMTEHDAAFFCVDKHTLRLYGHTAAAHSPMVATVPQLGDVLLAGSDVAETTSTHKAAIEAVAARLASTSEPLALVSDTGSKTIIFLSHYCNLIATWWFVSETLNVGDVFSPE